MLEAQSLKSHNRVEAACALEDAFRTLEPNTAGRGLDSHMPNEVYDHAMAYALYASAYAMANRIDDALVSALWLCNDARKPSGRVGWGLPFQWKAFGRNDSTENTIFGITSAFAVRALLDVSDRSGRSTSEEVAREFLDSYLELLQPASTGAFFPYSDESTAEENVFNVSAMLGGQYARAGKLWGRADYLEAARAVYENLVANRISSGKGDFWTYGSVTKRPNDAVHAAYTVQGILEIERNLGLGNETELQKSFRYLHKFFRQDRAFEFVFERTLPKKQRLASARLWGVGMLLFTAAEIGDQALVQLALQSLKTYWFDWGKFGLLPGHGVHYPRHGAHVALGLARVGYV